MDARISPEIKETAPGRSLELETHNLCGVWCMGEAAWSGMSNFKRQPVEAINAIRMAAMG
jgi:hypothetical protein